MFSRQESYYGQQKRPTSTISIIITIVTVLVGLVALYFLYKFLYGSVSIQATPLITVDMLGTNSPSNIPAIPAMYEGGDYSVSTWIYVNSYNINRNKRKHILQIGGPTFATLLIGLGAFKNTLIVRTHSRDTDSSSAITGSTSGNSGSNSTPQPRTPNSDEGMRMDGSLYKTDLDQMFQPLAMDDSIIDASPMCDLPEIHMQRWVHIVVSLSGRVVDVYLDGKLARSCITRSYYKVDPAGVTAKFLDRGGFDGHISSTAVYNYAVNPSDIYKLYQNGPRGNSTSVGSWFGSLFSSAK
jgi:hypothetical protein